MSAPEIVRVDRYTITVDGARIRADEAAEQRIRALSPEELDRFLTIMGVRP